MPDRSRCSDVEYHLRRARSEREIAYRSGDAVAGDAHMRLSALHLRRALLLQAVRSAPVGNVHPFRSIASEAPAAVRGERSLAQILRKLS